MGAGETHPCNWLSPSPAFLSLSLPWWSAVSCCKLGCVQSMSSVVSQCGMNQVDLFNSINPVCLGAIWWWWWAARVPHSQAQSGRSSGLNQDLTYYISTEQVFWHELCSIPIHCANDWPWSAQHSFLQNWTRYQGFKILLLRNIQVFSVQLLDFLCSVLPVLVHYCHS